MGPRPAPYAAANERVLADLKALKAKLLESMPIEHFILFGSRARGDWLLTSDTDLLVVSRAFEGIPFRRRPPDVIDHWQGPVDLEVLCYTPVEFERMRQRLCIVQQAVKEGIEL